MHIPEQHPEYLTPSANNLAYNPDNLKQAVENNEIPKTPTGLCDGVFLMGSTNVEWRSGVVLALNEAGIRSFNPDMGQNWRNEHAQVEALAMEKMSVLAIRAEKGGPNGSLGSLAEIGFAVLSGRLNGQAVIISIDPEYPATLTEPGAMAQYQVVLMNLLAAQSQGRITLLFGNREEYASAVQKAVKEQKEVATAQRPLSSADLQKILDIRRERQMRNNNPLVVIGGSSAPYSADSTVAQSFWSTFDQIDSTLKSWEPISLNQNLFANAWKNIPTINTTAADQIAKHMRTAFALEQGLKSDADILVWTQLRTSFGKAVATEIPWIIDHAFATGQIPYLLQEGFAADKCVQQALLEHDELWQHNDTEVRQMKFDLLVGQTEKVTYDRVRRSALKTEDYIINIVNTNRVHTIARAQLDRIIAKLAQIFGDQAPAAPLIPIAHDLEDLLTQLDQLRSTR